MEEQEMMKAAVGQRRAETADYAGATPTNQVDRLSPRDNMVKRAEMFETHAANIRKIIKVLDSDPTSYDALHDVALGGVL